MKIEERQFTISLNLGTTSETFQKSGKDSFKYILKTSANMYESSGFAV